MSDLIPYMFEPIEYANKFLDAPDKEHPTWTFCDVPIEADFELIPENISPYVIQILDRITEIEINYDSIATKITIINGIVDVK
jgi:hypothetical protein